MSLYGVIGYHVTLSEGHIIAVTWKRTPSCSVKGSGAIHYPRASAHQTHKNKQGKRASVSRS